MGRGRTIDKTLLPTRSLTAQRDYRARKSAHLKELQDTVARLTEENQALRAEVYDLRSRISSPDELPPSQLDTVVAARQQLLHALGSLENIIGADPRVRPRSPAAPRAWELAQDRQNGHQRQTIPPQQCAPQCAPQQCAPQQCAPNQCAPANVPNSTSRASSSPRNPASPLQLATRRGHSPPPPAPSITSPFTPGIRNAEVVPHTTSGLDPECCFGLFDCSDPLKVMIANGSQPPPPPEPEPEQCEGSECVSIPVDPADPGRGRYCLRT